MKSGQKSGKCLASPEGSSTSDKIDYSEARVSINGLVASSYNNNNNNSKTATTTKLFDFHFPIVISEWDPSSM